MSVDFGVHGGPEACVGTPRGDVHVRIVETHVWAASLLLAAETRQPHSSDGQAPPLAWGDREGFGDLGPRGWPRPTVGFQSLSIFCSILPVHSSTPCVRGRQRG